MTDETKTAIVTGGGSGIGAATVRALAERGMRVAVADIDLAAAEKVASLLNSEKLEAAAVRVDIGDPESIESMAKDVTGRWGRIDVLVNNAGIASSKPFLDIDLEEYERVMRINTTGAWLCCRAVIPVMLRQKAGSIVNVSSVAGQRGGGLLATAAYATSKGAVIVLTKALGREFAGRGIRVNAVAPSLTMTDLAKQQLDVLDASTLDRVIAVTPAGRAAEPAEIASVISYLASDEASFVFGHVYNVDGGTAM